MREGQIDIGIAQSQIGLRSIGNVQAAGMRAYTLGREAEELERLRMASEGRRLQSEMAFQPQMEALRSGIMGRMAGQLGISMPAQASPYQSRSGYTPSWGTGYTPSWAQNFQTPQFPRY